MAVRWLKTSIDKGVQKLPGTLKFLSARELPFIAVALRPVGARDRWHVEVPAASMRTVLSSAGIQGGTCG